LAFSAQAASVFTPEQRRASVFLGASYRTAIATGFKVTLEPKGYTPDGNIQYKITTQGVDGRGQYALARLEAMQLALSNFVISLSRPLTEQMAITGSITSLIETIFNDMWSVFCATDGTPYQQEQFDAKLAKFVHYLPDITPNVPACLRTSRAKAALLDILKEHCPIKRDQAPSAMQKSFGIILAALVELTVSPDVATAKQRLDNVEQLIKANQEQRADTKPDVLALVAEIRRGFA
jgi:hypothetical protein